MTTGDDERIMLKRFSRGLSTSFRHLGALVARRPWWFILGPLIFTAFSAIGCVWLRLDGDIVKLFGLTGSSYNQTRELILRNFPLSRQEHYDIGRETKFISGYGRILIETLDGDSIFRSHMMEEVLRIDEKVKSIKVSDSAGKQWDYESLCARYYGNCFVNPVINLAKHLDEFLSGKFKIKYPLELSEDHIHFHYYGAVLGEVTLDLDGNVANATKAQLVYFLDNVNPEKEALIKIWEIAFLDLIDSWPSKYLSMCKMASNTYRDEFLKIGLQVLPLFVLTGLAMITFCAFSCMSVDPLTTKPWIGVFGCFSALMGVVAGSGLCLWSGLTFPPLNFGVPFLLLAIGIDDTFIFLAAWRTTDPKDSVERRLALTYERSAVSVTLTSVTNCASFLACTTMPFMAIQIFGSYAAVSCVIVYLNQLTFMGGLMALLGRLEAAGYHGVIPWRRVDSQYESSSITGKVFCLNRSKDKSKVEKQEYQLTEMVLFKDTYGKFLTNKFVKATVLALFVCHVAVSIYGCSQLKVIMNLSDFSPYSSYGGKFTDLELRHFSNYSARVQFVIEEPVDYSNKKVQDTFYSFIKDIQDTPYVASEPILNEFWLTYYLMFLNKSRDSFLIRGYNTSTKIGFINCLRFQFFRLKQSQRFKNDVQFNSNYTEIISSRFIVQLVKTTNPTFMLEAYNSLMVKLKNFPFKMTFFHPLLVFLEALNNIVPALFTTIGFTILTMLIATAIFMPNITIIFAVSCSLVVIEVGIVGYLHFWGLSLNALTLFGATLFIGLSVDNTAHISHAFISSQKATLNEKMQDALGRVGIPIIQGALSSFVGLVALYFLPAYVYLVLFKTGMLVLSFSLANSLIVLPVIWTLRREQTKAIIDQEVKAPLNVSNHVPVLKPPTCDTEDSLKKLILSDL